MTLWHNPPVLKSPALAKLAQFVQGWQDRRARGTLNFEQFERELHALMLSVERERVEARLARYALDAGEYETFALSGLDLADTKGCGVARDGLSESTLETLLRLSVLIVRVKSRDNHGPVDLCPRTLVSTRTEASE